MLGPRPPADARGFGVPGSKDGGCQGRGVLPGGEGQRDLLCQEEGKPHGDAGLVPPRGSTGGRDALDVQCCTLVGTAVMGTVTVMGGSCTHTPAMGTMPSQLFPRPEHREEP